MPSNSHLTLVEAGEIIVVRLTDKHILDELVIRGLGEAIDDVLDQHPSPHLVIDFIDVEHLSSSALGLLITLNSRLADRSGSLSLVRIADSIQEVFRITRLDRVLQCHDDVDAARAAVRQGA